MVDLWLLDSNVLVGYYECRMAVHVLRRAAQMICIRVLVLRGNLLRLGSSLLLVPREG